MPHTTRRTNRRPKRRTTPQPSDPSRTVESTADQQVQGLRAYGCVYHVGAQTIAIAIPGDITPVRFSHNAYLHQMWHQHGAPDVRVEEDGIYEISYMLNLAASRQTTAAFVVQENGETLPGGLQVRALDIQEQVYVGTVMAELTENSTLRVVMTSGTVVSADLKGSGVTASLVIKRLD